jgi:hypothetical protein
MAICFLKARNSSLKIGFLVRVNAKLPRAGLTILPDVMPLMLMLLLSFGSDAISALPNDRAMIVYDFSTLISRKKSDDGMTLKMG